MQRAAALIQRWLRTRQARREFLRKRQAALYIQANIRGWMARKAVAVMIVDNAVRDAARRAQLANAQA